MNKNTLDFHGSIEILTAFKLLVSQNDSSILKSTWNHNSGKKCMRVEMGFRLHRDINKNHFDFKFFKCKHDILSQKLYKDEQEKAFLWKLLIIFT